MVMSMAMALVMPLFHRPKLLIFLCVILLITTSSAASSKLHSYYSDHCASIVPPTSFIGSSVGPPYDLHHTGYYLGGGDGGFLSPYPSYHAPTPVEFYIWIIRETDIPGLVKLQGSLKFPISSIYRHLVGNSTRSRLSRYSGGSIPHPSSSIQFSLDGFWSLSSGKLCMVGSGLGYIKGRSDLHTIHPVLKLNDFMNSTTVTSLFRGTLENPNDSQPISVLLLPSMINYQYTLASNKSENTTASGGSEGEVHKIHKPPSSLKIKRFCSVISRQVVNQEFDLKYSSHCTSAKNCTHPIPLASSDDLPRVVSLKAVECLDYNRRLRVLVQFSFSNSTNNVWWYQRPFSPNTTLVGEGSWDNDNDQLSIFACHFLDAASSWSNVRVGDCSVRLILRFPAVWTISNTSSILGEIWSNKSVTESGYFEKLTFESPQRDRRRVLIPGLRYEYTKLDEVTKLCPRKKSAHGNSTAYPDPFSYDMRFDMLAKNSKGQVGWGSCDPLSVGNQFYRQYSYPIQEENSVESTEEDSIAPVSVSYNSNHKSPYNISYEISISLYSDAKWGRNVSILSDMQISAEGVYDDKEGILCMVGCRNVGSKSQQQTNDSVDCQIAVNFQLSPTKKSGFIKGTIKSTRKKLDPLHFESLDLTSASGYLIEERQSIWRMDVEIILVLISTTLAGVFVALQLFHVKRHPDVVPSISIFMLLVLTLGYMIPLVLNFEAMFKNSNNRQSVFLGSGGWLEVNEVIVRVTTMVAFLLQIRLLQLTWSARSANGTQNELWLMEKKAFFAALLLYVVGALAVVFLLLHNWRKNINLNRGKGHNDHPILGTALKSYAGLVLDGFLLPQILLNMLRNSKENALSVAFYVGTTLVRVVPHVYDLYRAHHTPNNHLRDSYFYASPVSDFYSTAWDVIIPFGGLLFAGIIYLQHKFGGRCIHPKKLRNLDEYEMVTSVTEG